MDFVAILILLVLPFIFLAGHRKYNVAKRQRMIDQFRFPSSIGDKVLDKYPHLTSKQLDLVMKGLREYFHLCNIAGKRMVAMPSQVVDVAWHEFILFTRHYKNFCDKAFGRFLHHTPAEAMSSPTVAQEGIKEAWRISCSRDNIQPASPHKLPLLFAMDGDLNIPDGFQYALDCSLANSKEYCACHIGCGGGSDSGFDDFLDCGGDSGCGGCGGD